MGIHEIVLPETKPATEWVRGRALQKVSLQEPHARAQTRLVAALMAWADETGLGRVGTEWDFKITPPGEVTRPLVPDIAFLSFERLAYEQREEALIPRVAPDVAVEILSPGNLRADVEDKIRVYLAAGSKLVLLADPSSCTFTTHDAEGVKFFAGTDTFQHAALPGFSVNVGSVFEEFKPKDRRSA